MQNYSSASLTLINDDSTEELKHLLSNQKVTLIGRSPDCEIVLDPNKHPTVSRYHVQIELVEKNNQLSWAITDKGTTNGTLINGEKINATHILRSSDRIMLGLKGPEFLFEMEALNATVLVELPQEKKQEEPSKAEEVLATQAETKESQKQEVKEVKSVKKEETTTVSEEEEKKTTPVRTSRLRDKDKAESSATARKARRERKEAQTETKEVKEAKKAEPVKKEETPTVSEEEKKTTPVRTSRLKDKDKSEESPTEEKKPARESRVKSRDKSAEKEEKETEAKVEIDWNSLPVASLKSEQNVWNLISIKELATLEIDTKDIQCLSFNPQNQILAIAGKDKNIQLWDWQNKKEIVTLNKAHRMGINTLTFSSDSKKLASSGSDKTIKVWDVEKQEEICSLSGHKQAINTVILSNDGSKLVSSGSDKTIIVWDVEKQEEICSLSGHKMAINSLCLSQDSKFLISGGGDKLIKIWNLDSKEEEKSISTDSKSAIQSLTFSPNDNLILCIFQDNTISVFDRNNDQELFRFNTPDKVGDLTTVNNEGNLFASTLKEGGIIIWQI